MTRFRVTYWGFCREIVKWFDTAEDAREWCARHGKTTAVIDAVVG